MPSPKAVELVLSDEERDQLESWSRRRTSAQALATRSRVVLAAAEGLTNSEIAQRLGVSRTTVWTWRSRFVEDRLDGLVDEPRPGRPRTVTDAQVEEVIVRTLETTPRDATHWSTQVDGPGGRFDAVGGAPDLAGVWASAAPSGDVEALAGPAVHRQGA